MSEENNPESIFNIEEIISQFTQAMTKASLDLHNTFEGRDYRDLPYVYHIPQMDITLNMSLSYSKDKVKGIISRRKSAETSQQESQVRLSVVSIPRIKEKAKGKSSPQDPKIETPL